MRLRYRHRLDPDAAQRQAPARAFGCARVVYNDGLRLREDAYRAGLPYPSDGELCHRLTLAKLTPERAWLAKVSSVCCNRPRRPAPRRPQLLPRAQGVQGGQGAGREGKLKVRKPRFKHRRHDQAARFTANSRFRVLPDGRLSLPRWAT
jgi:putative transposase